MQQRAAAQALYNCCNRAATLGLPAVLPVTVTWPPPLPCCVAPETWPNFVDAKEAPGRCTIMYYCNTRSPTVPHVRSIVVGQRYTAVQYGAGALLVAGISLFTAGDAAGGKESSSTVTGVVLISIALVG